MAEVVKVFYQRCSVGRNSWMGGSRRRTVTGQGRHYPEYTFKIFALDREQFVQRFPAVLWCVGHDHFHHNWQAFGAIEHALSPAEADTHCTELQGAICVIRSIGIGHDFEPGHSVRHGQKFSKFR